MICVRKDEVKHLYAIGLGRFVIGKTCHGKKFAEGDKRVLIALKKYNARLVMED